MNFVISGGSLVFFAAVFPREVWRYGYARAYRAAAPAAIRKWRAGRVKRQGS